jgi:hypothetical protein
VNRAASPSEERKREEAMFGHHITPQLKPNLAKEFPVAFEKKIVPPLKKQSGVGS